MRRGAPGKREGVAGDSVAGASVAGSADAPRAEGPVPAIRRAIEAHGPISFAEFMELALYGPGGFYEQPPVGEAGHFVTSPHVHPVFGSLLASGLRAMWEALGQPQPFRLVEVGAGDGTLARQLLEHLKGLPLEYAAAERSPGARARLAGLPIRVVQDIRDVGEGLTGVVIANELLDNLPFRRVRRAAEGLAEVCVGLKGDRFVEVEVPCDPALAALAPRLRPGEEGTVPVHAVDFLNRLAAVLARGYALLIDYGSSSGRPPGPVHGYRRHRVVDEILAEPGTADITAGVDFGSLARRAEELGFATLGPVTQREALLALGFDRWNEQERDRQARLLEDRSIEAIRAWGGRSRASLLVDPTGLGRLRWLALATPGLPWAPWLMQARRARRPIDDRGARRAR